MYYLTYKFYILSLQLVNIILIQMEKKEEHSAYTNNYWVTIDKQSFCLTLEISRVLVWSPLRLRLLRTCGGSCTYVSLTTKGNHSSTSWMFLAFKSDVSHTTVVKDKYSMKKRESSLEIAEF